MSTRSVLLIDDEADIREVARASLEYVAGWTVLTAGSSEEALDAVAVSRPDAILLDVMMPGADGPETFRRLQSDPATREIPVIFLTAKTQAAEIRFLVELGARGVIAKPFDPLGLSGDVARLLEWT